MGDVVVGRHANSKENFSSVRIAVGHLLPNLFSFGIPLRSVNWGWMKKKILYMIFLPYPSAVVRATIFKELLEEDEYEVTYYYNYSGVLTRLQDFFKRSGFGWLDFPLQILQKVIVFLKIRMLMTSIQKFDAVILIKYVREAWIASLKRKFKGKILYDFDDAVWLPELMGKSEFENVVSSVNYVSTDNEYLKSAAEKHNVNTFVVNGPCQVELFDKYPFYERTDTSEVVIGWIGSSETVFYLNAIYDALEEIGSRHSNVILRLVGTGYDKSLIPMFEKIRVETVPTYNQAEMIRHVKGFDIGVFSLFNNSLSLGRGTLKATIYMAGQVPVVCSAIGDNTKMIVDGDNGFLANNKEEWVSKLEGLIYDPNLRKKIGVSGYQWVKANRTMKACYQQLKTNFLISI
jgi:glycosyltransferase involved in cell wall biosynthesis